jgi:N-acetylglucosamine-6-sulfatase
VDKPALMRTSAGLPPLGPATGTDDETIRNRLRLLAAVDEGMEAIFDALERTRQLDNTLLIFTSDNGYFYGEHGLSEERRLAYEESIRIPMLMRFPGCVRPRTAVKGFALTVDVAPTVLDLAGIGQHRGMQGRSLVPLLEGGETEWRRSFLVEYFSDTVMPRVRNMGYHAVRTAQWKYVHYTELAGMDELYDLERDPYEMRNIIDGRAAAPALASAKNELARLRGELGMRE